MTAEVQHIAFFVNLLLGLMRIRRNVRIVREERLTIDDGAWRIVREIKEVRDE